MSCVYWDCSIVKTYFLSFQYIFTNLHFLWRYKAAGKNSQLHFQVMLESAKTMLKEILKIFYQFFYKSYIYKLQKKCFSE